MPVQKTARKRRIVPLRDLPALVRNYVDAKVAATKFEDRRKEIRLQLLDLCEHDGEVDEAGNYWLDLPEHVEDSKGRLVNRVKMERRPRTNLKDELSVQAKLTDLNLLDQCMSTITVLDENKILKLHAAGDISEEDLASLYEETVTWSLPNL